MATTTLKNVLATAFGTTAVTVRVYSTAPTATAAGTAIGTVTPETISWSAAAGGIITATVTFDIPAGTTVKGAGVHDGSGAFLDGAALFGSSGQTWAADGTLPLTLTFTQS